MVVAGGPLATTWTGTNVTKHLATARARLRVECRRAAEREAFIFNDARAGIRGQVDRLREIEAALLRAPPGRS
jgi:hypothetical protein